MSSTVTSSVQKSEIHTGFSFKTSPKIEILSNILDYIVSRNDSEKKVSSKKIKEEIVNACLDVKNELHKNAIIYFENQVCKLINPKLQSRYIDYSIRLITVLFNRQDITDVIMSMRRRKKRLVDIIGMNSRDYNYVIQSQMYKYFKQETVEKIKSKNISYVQNDMKRKIISQEINGISERIGLIIKDLTSDINCKREILEGLVRMSNNDSKKLNKVEYFNSRTGRTQLIDETDDIKKIQHKINEISKNLYALKEERVFFDKIVKYLDNVPTNS